MELRLVSEKIADRRTLAGGEPERANNVGVRMLRRASCMPSLSCSMHGRSTNDSESEKGSIVPPVRAGGWRI